MLPGFRLTNGSTITLERDSATVLTHCVFYVREVSAMSGPIQAFTGDHDFLSNFFYAAVHWEGVEYPTVEHAFQAAKTDIASERRAIRECSSPSQAKRLGRRVELRDDWESVKVSIMESIVREKFTAHAELRAKLLATGDRRLVEGNTWNDTFWGVCRGHGKNHLGKILMRVRAELLA
jgi:ribA/ribD-fused uncharacterized protein